MNIMDFCSDNLDRVSLHHPIAVGEWVYASNGMVAIRVPRELMAETGWPDRHTERVLTYEFTRADAYAGVFAPLPPEGRCGKCDGTGLGICGECGQAARCTQCRGLGHAHEDVIIPPAKFAGHLLALIATLPGAELQSPPDARDPSAFRFDGGIGVIMPMRQD